MWNRYLKPRCANLVMHDAETRTVQTLLDTISREDKIAPQTQVHIKHLLSGMFRFAIAQGHLPRGTVNPVTFTETEAIPDFDGRDYSLEEIALMLTVLPERREQWSHSQLLLGFGWARSMASIGEPTRHMIRRMTALSE